MCCVYQERATKMILSKSGKYSTCAVLMLILFGTVIPGMQQEAQAAQWKVFTPPYSQSYRDTESGSLDEAHCGGNKNSGGVSTCVIAFAGKPRAEALQLINFSLGSRKEIHFKAKIQYMDACISYGLYADAGTDIRYCTDCLDPDDKEFYSQTLSPLWSDDEIKITFLNLFASMIPLPLGSKISEAVELLNTVNSVIQVYFAIDSLVNSGDAERVMTSEFSHTFDPGTHTIGFGVRAMADAGLSFSEGIVIAQILEIWVDGLSPPDLPTISGQEIISLYCSKADCGFEFYAEDPDGDSVRYEVDWGDGQVIDYGTYSTNAQDEQYKYTAIGEYAVRARALDHDGHSSEWSLPFYVKVCQTPPLPPENVVATDGEYADKILVTWQPNPCAIDAYSVYRSTSSTGSGSLRGQTNSPYFEDKTSLDDPPQPGTTYYYSVKSHFWGASANSSFDAGSLAEIQAPTNVWASTGTYCDKIHVYWDESPGATEYLLYRDTDRIPDDYTTISAPTHFYSDKDSYLVPGQIYRYNVRAYNGDDYSAWSADALGYAGPPPGPPATVSASNAEFCDYVHVTWDGVLGCRDYDIYKYQMGDDPSNAQIIPLNFWYDEPLFYDDEYASDFTFYNYAVVARSICGPSAMSDPDIGNRGPPLPPTGVDASDFEFCDKIRITWDSVSSDWAVTKYSLYRRGEFPPTYELVDPNITTTFYEDPYTSIDGGEFYSYKVKAHNDCGSSDYSEPDDGIYGEPSEAANVTVSELWQYCDKVTISWDGAPDAESYLIWRCTQWNPHYASLVEEIYDTGLSSYQYDDTACDAVTEYHYWVQAKNTCGISNFVHAENGSPIIGMTGRQAIPDTLAWTEASNGEYPDKIHVRWGSRWNADCFDILRNNSDDPDTADVIVTCYPADCESGGCYYDDLDVYSGQYYYYWIRSRNFCGVSEPGGWANLSQEHKGWVCLDDDYDNICNNQDNCPENGNPNQTDSDGDNVGDVCDNCVDIYNPNQEDWNDDGIGDHCDEYCFDLDGLNPVNFLDFYILQMEWLDTGPGLEADINEDEVVNIEDLEALLVDWLNDCN